jgi:hypothetical protein
VAPYVQHYTSVSPLHIGMCGPLRAALYICFTTSHRYVWPPTCSTIHLFHHFTSVCVLMTSSFYQHLSLLFPEDFRSWSGSIAFLSLCFVFILILKSIHGDKCSRVVLKMCLVPRVVVCGKKKSPLFLIDLNKIWNQSNKLSTDFSHEISIPVQRFPFVSRNTQTLSYFSRRSAEIPTDAKLLQ